MKHIKTLHILLLIASIQFFIACTSGGSKENKFPEYEILRLFETDKQLVIWALLEEDESESPQKKVQILHPTTGEILKEFSIAKASETPRQLGKHVYTLDETKGMLEARDALTGEVKLNNTTLESNFGTQLAEGIGQVDFSRHGWIRIITKKGKDYYYNPVLDVLIDSKTTRPRYLGQYVLEGGRVKVIHRGRWQAEDTTNKAGWVSQWCSLDNPVSPKEKRFILTQTYLENSQYKIKQVVRSQDWKLQKSVDEGKTKLMSNPEDSKFLLDPKVIYSNKNKILFIYKTEISPQAKGVLACQNNKGKIIWEKKLKSNKMLEKALTLNTSDYTAIADPEHENILAVAAVTVHRDVIGLNLDTGQVVWSYINRFHK